MLLNSTLWQTLSNDEISNLRKKNCYRKFIVKVKCRLTNFAMKNSINMSQKYDVIKNVEKLSLLDDDCQMGTNTTPARAHTQKVKNNEAMDFCLCAFETVN